MRYKHRCFGKFEINLILRKKTLKERLREWTDLIGK
jgi:hypothetical protein